MAKSRVKKFSIGVDYGTNSVRALVVDVDDGREVGTSVYSYPTGKAGILLDQTDPNLARQNPGDYVNGFFAAVRDAVKQAGKEKEFSPESVVGIGIDTTGSTPIPVNRKGVPLCLEPAYRGELAAHAWLWKDHTGYEEAAIITDTARKGGEPYLAKCGMTYSSEWFWSKVWHCLRTTPQVFRAAFSWVEACDFIPSYQRRS